MGDTPTSPVKGFALATLYWPLRIDSSRLRRTLIIAILFPYGEGTP